MESEAVCDGVPRSANVSNTEKFEEIAEVWFRVVDKLEGGSQEIVDCQG